MPHPLHELFLSQMQLLLKEEFPNFEKSMQLDPPTSIRLNPFRKKPTFATPESVKWAENGYFLAERPIFTSDPNFHAGAYYVQESSSMFIEQILKSNVELTVPLKVLDLCAAPGGKTTHLASLLHPESLIISNEINPKRYHALQHNIAKWGYSNVWTTRAQPSEFKELQSFFDIILIDAPCSGEGMMRKDEFAAAQWAPELIVHCSAMQENILEEAIPLLKDRGLLIYSTCTFNTIENEEKMQYLSEQNFESAKVVEGFPEVKRTEVNGVTGYRFFPHHTPGEGFFVTALCKNHRETEHKNKKLSSDPFWNTIKPKFEPAEYLNHSNFIFLQKSNADIFAIQAQQDEDWYRIKRIIKHMEPSLKLGQMKGKDMIPHVNLAWSNHISPHLPTIELSLDDALEYLRRNNVFKENPIAGWNLISYNGNNLGWIKNLNNRWNNYYPAEYKILHY